MIREQYVYHGRVVALSPWQTAFHLTMMFFTIGLWWPLWRRAKRRGRLARY